MATRERVERRREISIGKRLLDVLAVAYRAGCPALLEGPTGIGKSDIVQQAAARLGIHCIVLDLSLLEPPDLVGLPLISDGRTSHAAPSCLPTGGAGILMLEEINRAEKYMQQPAMQLLTARMIHSYVLPRGWCPFAAINPEHEDYQVTPLDPALRARFLNLTLRADRKEWIDWATQKRVHQAVLAVAKAHDRFLESVPPRTWKMTSDVLLALTPGELNDDPLLRDVLGGLLPDAWVETLLETIRSSGIDLGVDLHAAVRSRSAGRKARKSVQSFRDAGETDRLDEITSRLAGMLESPELGALLGRGEFALGAFEALIAELPGDHRERLQEMFARNPLALGLVETDARDIVDHYQTGPGADQIRQWLGDEMRRHRAWSVAWNLPAYIRKNCDLVELKKNNRAKANLGRLVADLGPRWAAPLAEGLRELGLTPIFKAPPGKVSPVGRSVRARSRK